jgi:toxin ParE1/3/4
MTSFRFTPEAKRHLSQIWRYSANAWGVRRADKNLKAINKAVADVAAKRRQARGCEEYGAGLLRIYSGSHAVYLRYEPQSEFFVVVGVLHQQMDPVRHLHEPEGGDGTD